MSDDRTFERNARAWLELGPTDPPDRVVQAALLTIESTTQERDLRIPWRFPTMTTRVGLAVAAVLGVLAVGLISLNLPGRNDVGHPTQSPTPPATTGPSPSAAGDITSILPGWIVFEHAGKAPDGSTPAGVDYPASLWLIHADGSNLHELAPGLPAVGKVSFDISPDGKKVAFGTNEVPAQIWEVAIGGGDPYLLSTDCSGQEGECLEGAPAYSPTGLSIAFLRARAGQPDVIGIRDLVTDEVTLVETTRSSSTDIWLAEPSWSPDGQQLVYGEIHYDKAQDKIVDARLFIVNADGSGRHEVALPTGLPFGDADWSPDGSRLVFSSCPIHEFNDACAAVYTSRLDGTDLQVLTPLNVGYGAPTWTPDGLHILYWGPRNYYVMDPDGSNPRKINQMDFGDTGGYGYYGRLQPTH